MLWRQLDLEEIQISIIRFISLLATASISLLFYSSASAQTDRELNLTSHTSVSRPAFSLAPVGTVGQELIRDGLVLISYNQNRAVSRYDSLDSKWNDELISGYVTRVLDRILASSNLPGDFVELNIETCPQTGASIRSGGIVTMCLPLVLTFETEDEIAFILAHEISHWIKSVGNTQANTGGKVEPILLSKTEEVWADELALDLLINANYSPEGALIFFDVLEQRSNEICCDEHYDTPATRTVKVVKYLDKNYQNSWDTIDLTALSDDFLARTRRATEYLVRLDSAFGRLIEKTNYGRRKINNERLINGFALIDGEAAAKWLNRECKNSIEQVESITNDFGYQPVALQFLSSIFIDCLSFVGINERYDKLFSKFIDIQTADFNELAALLHYQVFIPESQIYRKVESELLSRSVYPNDVIKAWANMYKVNNFEEQMESIRHLRMANYESAALYYEACTLGGALTLEPMNDLVSKIRDNHRSLTTRAHSLRDFGSYYKKGNSKKMLMEVIVAGHNAQLNLFDLADKGCDDFYETRAAHVKRSAEEIRRNSKSELSRRFLPEKKAIFLNITSYQGDIIAFASQLNR